MFKIIKEQYSIGDFISLYERSEINLTPRYQRTGGLWNKAKNQLLIDSIFNGIDLPKFYLHIFPEKSDKPYKYAVVDGKQRILAISQFLNDGYPLNTEFQFWEQEVDVDISGMYFSEIEKRYPRLAGQFLMFTLDISVIDTDDIDRIDNMFIRINEGVRVNPAEKRNAYGGKLIDYIAEACAKSRFFQRTLNFSDERKAYQELFLKIYTLEKHGFIISLGDRAINQVLSEGKNCESYECSLVDRIFEKLEEISRAFGERERLFKKSNIILYYWFLRTKDSIDANVVDFIRFFEKERTKAERESYQRFNELTRQGIYQATKMEERLRILESEYKRYCQ